MRKMGKKGKVTWSVLAGYSLLNLIVFVANPYASAWHYHSRDPVPFRIGEPADQNLSLDRLVRILDDIDLAYGAREPTTFETAKALCLRVVSILFLPATTALGMKEFVGYIGPPTEKQEAFTVSVKRRYNYLARLAIERGYREDRFMYEVEPSQSKRHGARFGAVRGNGSDPSDQMDDGGSQQAHSPDG